VTGAREIRDAVTTMSAPVSGGDWGDAVPGAASTACALAVPAIAQGTISEAVVISARQWLLRLEECMAG